MQVKHPVRFPLLVMLTLSIIAISRMPSASAAHDDTGTQPALAAAIAGPDRSEANKARDKYRHPMETLTFFGIEPAMTVVEISPGAGWYTEILAPFLKDHGKLYEAVGGGAGAKALEEKLKADPAVYGQVIVTVLHEYCRRVARRMSRTAFSASSECVSAFDLISAPSALKMSQKSPLPQSLQTVQLVLTGNNVAFQRHQTTGYRPTGNRRSGR